MVDLDQYASVGRDLRALARVGWPLILNNLFGIGTTVADTLMIGRLGATQLAALAIGSSLWIGIFLGGLGVLMALGPTVAQHFGAKQYAAIGHDTHQAVWLALIITVVVVALLHAVTPLLTWLRIDAEVSRLAAGYLHALSFGVPGLYLYQVMRQMNEGIGRTIPIMIVTAIALVINIALSAILVFGLWGGPRLGVLGSGIGSALSYWCMCGLLAFYIVRTPFYAPFDLWSVLRRPDPLALRRLVALGGPIGLSLLMQAGLFTALALLMGTLGKNYAAAHQITLNYAGLVFMVPLGLAFATAVLVGQAIGRRQPATALRVGKVGITLCLGIAAGFGLTTFLFAPCIARLYTQDAAVVSLAASLLTISAFLQVGDGTQSAAAGALRGLKDTRVPMVINGAIYWLVGFASAYSLGIGAGYGARGIWFGLALALCTAAIVLTWRFRRVVGRQIAVNNR